MDLRNVGQPASNVNSYRGVWPVPLMNLGSGNVHPLYPSRHNQETDTFKRHGNAIGLPNPIRGATLDLTPPIGNGPRFSSPIMTQNVSAWLAQPGISAAEAAERADVAKLISEAMVATPAKKPYSLDLRDKTQITSLPAGIEFSGPVKLKNCKKLEELPPSFEVVGDVDLKNCSSLKKLPQKFHVRGNLDLRGCAALVELPQDLKVDSMLHLKGLLLSVVPETVQVGGGIDISECINITRLPGHLVASPARNWWGERWIDISDSGIRRPEFDRLHAIEGDNVIICFSAANTQAQ